MTEIRRRLEIGESKRSIAERMGCNEATLRKRLRIGTFLTSLGRFKPIFSPDMELQLSQYCKDLDNTFYGLTIKALRELVIQFAERNGLNIDSTEKQRWPEKTGLDHFVKDII